MLGTSGDALLLALLSSKPLGIMSCVCRFSGLLSSKSHLNSTVSLVG